MSRKQLAPCREFWTHSFSLTGLVAKEMKEWVNRWMNVWIIGNKCTFHIYINYICVCVYIFNPRATKLLFDHGMMTQLLSAINFHLAVEYDTCLHVNSWGRSIYSRETQGLGLPCSRWGQDGPARAECWHIWRHRWQPLWIWEWFRTAKSPMCFCFFQGYLWNIPLITARNDTDPHM